MNPKTWLTVLVFLFSFAILQAQPRLEYSLGDNTSNRLLKNVYMNNDGGYYMIGASALADSQKYEEVLRMDACNNRKWGKRIPVSSMYHFKGRISIKTKDGNLLLLQYYAGAHTINMTKMDSNGNVMWSYAYTVSGNATDIDYAVSCQNTNDGGYIVLAKAGNGFVLVKTNNNGKKIWMQSYGGTLCKLAATVENVFSLKDGGFLVLASGTEHTGSSCVPNAFFYAMKTDAGGHVEWSKYYSEARFTSVENGFLSCVEYENGDLYISGTIDGLIAVCKLDGSGNQKWCKLFYDHRPPGLVQSDMVMAADRNLIVGGYYGSRLQDSFYTGRMFKIDTSGKFVWFRTYATNNNILTAINQISLIQNNRFILGLNLNYGYTNGYAMAIDSDNYIYDNFGPAYCLGNDVFLDSAYIDLLIKSTDIPVYAVSFGTQSSFNVKPLPFRLKKRTYCDFYHGDHIKIDTAFCFGNTYHVNLRPGNEGYHFTWNNGDTAASRTFSQTGMYTAKLTNGSCMREDTVRVTFYKKQLVNLGPDRNICPNEGVFLKANGDSGVNFEWRFPGNIIKKGRQVLAKDSGTYIVKVADAGGCVDLDTLHLGHYPMPDGRPGPDTTLCYNQEYTIHAAGGITYKWIPATYLSADSIADPMAKLPITQRYLLIVTNAEGCKDTTPLTLTVRPRLVVKLSASAQRICSGQRVKLTATSMGGVQSAYKISWLDDVLGNDSMTQPLTQGGWHRVQLQDNCSPPARDSVFIRVDGSPVVKITAQPIKACEPMTVNFNAVPDSVVIAAYRWMLGDGDSAITQNFSHNYSKHGEYQVSLAVKSTGGCQAFYRYDSTITVIASPLAAFNLHPERASLSNATIFFNNQSEYATRYTWLFDDKGDLNHDRSTHFTYRDTGHYLVKLIAINGLGCPDTATGQVYIHDNFKLFVPDVFSPNGDGINDLFHIEGQGITDYSYVVYNRWGEAIFHSTDHKKDWNGAIENKGPIVMEGVYIYQLKAIDLDPLPHYFSGNITLTR